MPPEDYRAPPPDLLDVETDVSDEEVDKKDVDDQKVYVAKTDELIRGVDEVMRQIDKLVGEKTKEKEEEIKEDSPSGPSSPKKIKSILKNTTFEPSTSTQPMQVDVEPTTSAETPASVRKVVKRKKIPVITEKVQEIRLEDSDDESDQDWEESESADLDKITKDKFEELLAVNKVSWNHRVFYGTFTGL